MFESFIIPPYTTAFNVLKNIQRETQVNIYMKGNELNIHPKYIEKFGKAVYDFAVNVEKSDLKYREAKDNEVEIVVEGTDIKGFKKSVRVGTMGGMCI